MKDRACIEFLQWALPKLQFLWPGFRRVRHQVCKRLDRRMKELNLASPAAYQEYLEVHSEEWQVLDSLCRITISRFYRDRGVFDSIGEMILPAIAQMVADSGGDAIRCWCAGCASGEEPYTLMMIWELRVKQNFPKIDLQITATDADPVAFERSKRRCYSQSSVKELPADWVMAAFEKRDKQFCLLPRFAENIHFAAQDIRLAAPEGLFHLIFCRNLAFTYFNKKLQHEIAARIYDTLLPGGAVVVGIHEYFPWVGEGISPWIRNKKIYRKDLD